MYKVYYIGGSMDLTCRAVYDYPPGVVMHYRPFTVPLREVKGEYLCGPARVERERYRLMEAIDHFGERVFIYLYDGEEH